MAVSSNKSKMLWTLFISLAAVLRVAFDVRSEGLENGLLQGFVALLLIGAGGFLVGRMVLKNNTLGRATRGPIWFYLMFSVGLAGCDIRFHLMSLIVLFALFSVNRATVSSGQISYLFNTGFWLGALFLLEPSTLCYGLVLALVWIIFGRSLRSLLLLHFGVSMPVLTYFVFQWAFHGIDLQHEIAHFLSQAISIRQTFGLYPIPQILLWVLLCIIAIAAPLRSRKLTLTVHAKEFLLMSTYWIILAFPLLILTSFEAKNLAIVTAPAAISASALVLSQRKFWRIAVFVICGVLCFLF